jgi:hypothetical protein
MPRTPQPPSLESKSHKIGDKGPKIVAYGLNSDTLRKLALLQLKAAASPPSAWTRRREEKPKKGRALLQPRRPRRLALPRPKVAASPPNAWTHMRKKEPKANRTGTTPPTRAWSWPALYLRCQRASDKCANTRPKKSSPPGTELLFWPVAKFP